MRKLLLIQLALFAGVCVSAQQRVTQDHYPQGFKKAEVPAHIARLVKPVKANDHQVDNGTPLNNLQSRRWVSPTRPGLSTTTLHEDVIGYTYYDLQTNGTVSNRITRNTDGTVSASWTFSPNATSGYPQRGTGYNFYDGSQWYYTPSGPGGDFPNSRIEPTSRTGFVNIVTTSNGREMSIAHSSTAGHMLLTDRAGLGPVNGGAWTEETNALGTGTNNDTWAKACADGDHVYMVCQGSGVSAVSYLGQDGPLLFSRSDDGGQTWPVSRQLITEVDSAFYLGFGGDDYSIDARNGVVAIAFGGLTTDFGLLKSTDYGATWTKTIIHTFPVPFFSLATMFTYFHGPGTPVDTVICTTDPHVLIDNGGMCHVFFSTLRWRRDSTVQANYFQPEYYKSDALNYWNETMPMDGFYPIAASMDYNGNGILDFATPVDTTCDYLGTYSGGLTQKPSAGIDAAGNLFVAYQSVCEGCDTLAYHELHKHVFMITSSDTGRTWSYPLDIVPSIAQGGDGEDQEAVYATIAKNVDASAWVVYQRDPAPGESLNTSNACEVANNSGASDIVAVQVEAATVGMNTVNSNNVVVTQNYPNPAHGSTAVNVSIKSASDIQFNVSNILGNVLHSEIVRNAAAGRHTITFDTSGLSPGIYFYSIKANGVNVTKKMIIE